MTSSESEPRIPALFRIIQEKDFDQVVEMITAEGFYLPHLKLELIIREGQSDFYVLEDTSNGNILGVANVSKTRDGEAMLGNVVVRKDRRHQGLGTYLLRHVFSLHEDVLINWFSAADDLYRKLGCKFPCPQAACYIAQDFNRDQVKQYCQENKPEYSVTTVPLTHGRREDFSRYDTQSRGYENRKYISILIGFAHNITIAVAEDDKRILGYVASCEEDGNVLRINAFYANNDKIAALLLRHIKTNMTTPRAVSLDSLEVRQSQTSDHDDIVELIAKENWFIFEKSNFELILQKLEPVFYVLVDKSANSYILGTINVCKTRDGEAIVCNVIIRDGFRGKGFGRFMVHSVFKLYSHVILSWFSTTNAFYKKIGYHPCGQAAFFGNATVDRKKVELYCQENKLKNKTEIVAFTEDKKQDLIQYDAGARGYTAEKGLTATIATSDFFAIAVQGKDERIVGYIGNYLEPAGSLRPNGFYADDETIAAHLLRETLNNLPAVEKLQFYALETNQFLAEFGKLDTFETHTRFSHGGIPAKIPGKKLYAFNQPDMCY